MQCALTNGIAAKLFPFNYWSVDYNLQALKYLTSQEMFALKRKLDFLRCIREPRNYGLSLQDSKSLEKATKIRLEKKCTSLRNRCFSLFLFFFECFCKGLRKFATGLPSFPSLEKSLSSIQYRQYCSSRRVRLVYPTNFLFLTGCWFSRSLYWSLAGSGQDLFYTFNEIFTNTPWSRCPGNYFHL